MRPEAMSCAPALNRIHLSPPDVGADEEIAVLRALRSGWVAPLGPEVDAFERELAAATDRQHAVALASGTAALHLGLLALGVGPGDVVLTSTMTFAATVNAILYTGARPVLVDCDESGAISVDLLVKAYEDRRAQSASIKAILPVDLFGKVADYRSITPLAERWDLPVLSDAAESVGAQRYGRPAGSFGHAAALSFNGNKVMTTSGGGALLTDDAARADYVRYLASQARQQVRHYEHTEVGFNYRLSNLLAALGRPQLARLPEMIQRRRALRLAYRDFFAEVPGVHLLGEADGQPEQEDHRENFWLTCVVVDPAQTGWTSSELVAWLEDANIEARPLWKPMHTQPVFAGAPAYLNGTSEFLYHNGLSLPSGSGLDEGGRGRVLSALSEFLELQRRRHHGSHRGQTHLRRVRGKCRTDHQRTDPAGHRGGYRASPGQTDLLPTGPAWPRRKTLHLDQVPHHGCPGRPRRESKRRRTADVTWPVSARDEPG